MLDTEDQAAIEICLQVVAFVKPNRYVTYRMCTDAHNLSAAPLPPRLGRHPSQSDSFYNALDILFCRKKLVLVNAGDHTIDRILKHKSIWQQRCVILPCFQITLEAGVSLFGESLVYSSNLPLASLFTVVHPAVRVCSDS